MKQISWRRMSILGIVLMGASAVTAAVLPSKSEARDKTGSLTQAGTADAGAAVFSCTTSAGTPDAPCNITAGTATTNGSAANSYDANNDQTTKNTTTV